MNIFKLSAIILAMTSSFSSFADNYVMKSPVKVELAEWQPLPPVMSAWKLDGDLYGCSDWSPDKSTVDYGQDFIQSRSCKQDEKMTESRQEKSVKTGEIRDLPDVVSVRTTTIDESQNETGSYAPRSMCIDILNRGESNGDGIYIVDPDGASGPLAAKNAYCLMSQGGWTLYDSFGDFDGESRTSSPAYNARGIKSTGALSSAGYTYYLNAINNGSYHVTGQYMQFFYGGSPYGYIRKTMPSWVKAVRADVSNQWRGATDYVGLGSDYRALPGWQKHTEFTFNGTGVLEIKETSIVWVDAVWVK